MIEIDIADFLKPYNLTINDIKGRIYGTERGDNLHLRRLLFHHLHFKKNYSYKEIGLAVGLDQSHVASNINFIHREEVKKELSIEQQIRINRFLKIEHLKLI